VGAGVREAGARARAVTTATTTPLSDVRTVAADVRSRLKNLLGGAVVAGSSSRRLVGMLAAISDYAAQNPRVNVHLHLIDSDQHGNTFWLPTHEDQQLFDSAAGKVMARVYRVSKSGDAMQHGSNAINPLLNDRAPAGDEMLGQRRRAGPVTIYDGAAQAGDSTPAGAAVSAGATAGSAAHTTLAASLSRPSAFFSTLNPRSQISTAPVASTGPLMLVALALSTSTGPPDSRSGEVASGWRGVGVNAFAGRDLAGRDTPQEPTAAQELAAVLAGDGTDQSSAHDDSHASDAGSDSMNEDEDGGDFLLQSRSLHR